MTYLLQVSTCWIFFFGIYLLFLRQETFFSINRYYLLGALATGLLVPFLGGFLPANEASVEVYQVMTTFVEVETMPAITVVEEQPFDWMRLLWMAYILGASVVFLRFAYGLYKIYSIYAEAEKTPHPNYTLVESDKYHLPFSFFHFIFISKNLPLNKNVDKVLKHEELHANQWHSVDIVFTEMLQVFFWFNPILVFYKNALRQSHEYLADAYVTQDHNKNSYGQLLLQQSTSGLEIALANQFFHSQIKKRITMMYTEKSKRSAMVKYLAAVPVLVAMLLIFSSNQKGGNEYSKDEIRKEFTALYESVSLEESSFDQMIKWDRLLNKFINKDNFSKVSTEFEDIASEFGIFLRVEESKNGFPYSFSPFMTLLPSSKLNQFRTNQEVKNTYQAMLKDMSSMYDKTFDFDVKVEANGVYTFPPTNKDTKDITSYFKSIREEGRLIRLDVDPNAPSGKVGTLLDCAYKNDVGVILNAPDLNEIDSLSSSSDKTNKELSDIMLINNGITVLSNGAYMFEGTPLTDKEVSEIINRIADNDGILKISALEGSEWKKISKLMSLAADNGVKSILETKTFETDNFDGRKIIQRNWHFLLSKYKSIEGKISIKAEADASGDIIYTEIIEDETTIDNKAILKDALLAAKGFKIEKGNKNAFGELVFNLGGTKPHQGYTYYQDADVFKFDNEINLGEQIPEGSIEVRVEGKLFTENKDYTIDYTTGKLKMLNYDAEKPVNVSFKDIQEDPIFKVVEEMPRFPGCEEMQGESKEKENCAKQKMLNFIYENLTYPSKARDTHVQGMVVIQFVIEKNGTITGAKIVRDIGAGCGEESQRVVSSMPTWRPGMQKGKPVRVQYTLPVKFKLEGNTNIKKEEIVNVVGFGDANEKAKKENLQINKVDKSTNTENSEVFKVVQEMPRFPGCEDLDGTTAEKEECAKHKMLEYIYTNIKYPKEARAKGIDGMSVIRMTIEKDGSINLVNTLRDPGAGTGAEAARVVREMPTWIPGKQDGEVVRVQYTLPVKFKLEGDESSDVKDLLKGKISGVKIDGSDPDRKIVLNSGYDGPPPLYVIDGKIRDGENIEEIAPDDIKAIHVLKGEKAIEKYGDKGEHGVIEITMKTGNPIYVIDGEIRDEAAWQATHPDMVKSYVELNKDKASKKYGKKGKNGAIEVTRKAVKLKTHETNTSFKCTAGQFKRLGSITAILNRAGLVEESKANIAEFTLVRVEERKDAEVALSTDGTFSSGIKDLVSKVKVNDRYFFERIKINSDDQKENLGAVSILIIKEEDKYLIDGQIHNKDFYSTIDKTHINKERPATKEEKFMRAIDGELTVVNMLAGYGYNSAYFPGTNTEDGSNQALLDYVGNNIKYPKSAMDNNIEGLVTVRYTVEADGQLTNFKIGRSVGWGLDEAVLEMMKKLADEKGPWKAAYLDRRSVASSMVLPVKFKLQDNQVKEAKTRRLNIDRLDISPNPNDGVFNLSFELEEKTPVDILFYSLSGQLIREIKGASSSYKNSIDLSNYSGQTILINIVQNGKVHTNKVIIQ